MQDRPRTPPKKQKTTKAAARTPLRADRVVRVGVTEFKARCLALIEKVNRGHIDKVILTRHDKDIVEISAVRPTREEVEASYGALKHLVNLRDDVDLTAPLDIELDAEKGILYNDDP